MVGEGADELFGGYPTYIGALLARPLLALAAAASKSAIAAAVDALPVSDKKVTLSYLLKRFVEGDEFDGPRATPGLDVADPAASSRRLGVSRAARSLRAGRRTVTFSTSCSRAISRRRSRRGC